MNDYDGKQLTVCPWPTKSCVIVGLQHGEAGLDWRLYVARSPELIARVCFASGCIACIDEKSSVPVRISRQEGIQECSWIEFRSAPEFTPELNSGALLNSVLLLNSDVWNFSPVLSVPFILVEDHSIVFVNQYDTSRIKVKSPVQTLNVIFNYGQKIMTFALHSLRLTTSYRIQEHSWIQLLNWIQEYSWIPSNR